MLATFANAVSNEAATSKFKVSVGSTSALPPEEEDDLWSDLEEPISMMVDLNDLEGSFESLEAKLSAVGKAAKGVSAEHLSKVWSIDLDTAKKTIDLTTQLCKHGESDHLRRQYSTNDRMLRYKRINTHFFTDTFQVTEKAISSRKNRYIQLFVSDAGFMYVVPMEKKTDILKAVK